MDQHQIDKAPPAPDMRLLLSGSDADREAFRAQADAFMRWADPVNFEQLLRKYVSFVQQHEGIDFTDRLTPDLDCVEEGDPPHNNGSDVEFTQAEIVELQRISNDPMGQLRQLNAAQRAREARESEELASALMQLANVAARANPLWNTDHAAALRAAAEEHLHGWHWRVEECVGAEPVLFLIGQDHLVAPMAGGTP